MRKPWSWIAAAALALVTLGAPSVARAGVHVSVGIGLPFFPVPRVAVVAPVPYPVVVGGPVVYSAPVYYGPGFVPRRAYFRPARFHRGCGHRYGHRW